MDAEQGLICGEGVRRGATGALVVVEGGGEDPNILRDAEADVPGVEDEAFLDEGENSILIVAGDAGAGRLDGVKDHGAGLFGESDLGLGVHVIREIHGLRSLFRRGGPQFGIQCAADEFRTVRILRFHNGINDLEEFRWDPDADERVIFFLAQASLFSQLHNLCVTQLNRVVNIS